MTGAFLGRGWKFPVQPDTNGAIAMSEYEDDIKEALAIILGTAKGERVMRPDFGCGIHDYTFAVINSSVLGLVEASVMEALTAWEPRIETLNVKALTDGLAAGKLLISIDYRVRTTNNQFNLVYPFYLTESK